MLSYSDNTPYKAKLTSGTNLPYLFLGFIWLIRPE